MNVMRLDERYLHDPIFHNLVDVISHELEKGNFTPTEAREAVHLACLHFEQRRISTGFYVRRDINNE